jgi:hypothetical protein
MIDSNKPRRPHKWVFRAGATLAATVFLVGSGALAANAAGTYRTLSVANVRSAPTTTSLLVSVLTKGSSVTIDCYSVGQNVSGTTIWDHLVNGGYVSDSLILTFSNKPVVPICGAYNRSAAASWALAHVNDAPRYPEDDCTWFVSQALWAGGLAKSVDWSDTRYGLPYPTWDAVNADYFKNYIASQSGLGTIQQLSTSQKNVPQAQLGDIIAYDWNHDGKVDHVVIVTSISGQYPTISSHTYRGTQAWDFNSAGVPLSRATPGYRAYLIHITR